MQVEHTTLQEAHSQTHTDTHTRRQAHTVQHKLAINSQALISRRPTFILSPEQGEIFTRLDSTRVTATAGLLLKSLSQWALKFVA